MEICIREARSDDVPEILRQRRGMYQDMGYEDDAALGKMVSVCEPYLAQALRQHSFRLRDCGTNSFLNSFVSPRAVCIAFPICTVHPGLGLTQKAIINRSRNAVTVLHKANARALSVLHLK